MENNYYKNFLSFKQMLGKSLDFTILFSGDSYKNYEAEGEYSIINSTLF